MPPLFHSVGYRGSEGPTITNRMEERGPGGTVGSPKKLNYKAIFIIIQYNYSPKGLSKMDEETASPTSSSAPQTHYLMTCKMTNQQFLENCTFREKNPAFGCIYGAPLPITMTIPLETVLFVLEMNVTDNRIEGIGMLKLKNPRSIPVYSNGNQNRYVYHGKFRISRDQMTKEEEEIMQFFDRICFYGKHHLKCIQGILKFPPKILERCKEKMDLLEFIKKMFKARLIKGITK